MDGRDGLRLCYGSGAGKTRCDIRRVSEAYFTGDGSIKDDAGVQSEWRKKEGTMSLFITTALPARTRQR